MRPLERAAFSVCCVAPENLTGADEPDDPASVVPMSLWTVRLPFTSVSSGTFASASRFSSSLSASRWRIISSMSRSHSSLASRISSARRF